MTFFNGKTVVGAGSIMLGAWGLAQAQGTVPASSQRAATDEAGGGVLGEIVVTAQKRSQNIQDVGISITALSGEAMDALHLTNMQDIGQQVPGLQLQTFTQALTIFNLRGVSQNNFQDNLEAPVAVYVNDAYVGSMNAIGQQMFDMDRVEVLRGPQGTLFGRNATGGLIHFITHGADEDKLNGYGEASFASFNTYNAEGAVGGAVSPGFRLRIAGRYEHSDGYVKPGFNPLVGRMALGGPSHGANGWALRGSAQVDMSDATRLDVIASASRDHRVPTGQYTVRFAEADPETGLGINAGPPLTGDVHQHASDENPYFNRTVWSGTAKLTSRLSDTVTLTSVSNFTSMKKDYTEDAGGGLVHFPFETIADYDQVSQELRLSNDTGLTRWQVGAYYLNMDFDGSFTAIGLPITGEEDGQITGTTRLRSRNWSVFGQIEHDLSKQWTSILGLRWSQDNKDIRFRTRGYHLTGIPDGSVLFDFADQIAANPQYLGDDRINYGDVAVRAQLNFKPADHLLYYLSYNRGIKGGNWSPSPSVDLANFRHKNEVLNSFELGVKSTLAPGLRLNATAFYYDYRNYQAFALTGLQPQVTNSDATVKGGEIELFAHPAASLDMAFGASFLDSKVDFVPAVFPGTGTVDARLPQAPGMSLNGLIRYAVGLGSHQLALQVDGRYNTSQYLEGTNSQVSHQRAYGVANASVSFSPTGDAWEMTFWVKNFTNTDYLLYNLDLGLAGFVEQVYAPPRQFGGTVRFRF